MVHDAPVDVDRWRWERGLRGAPLRLTVRGALFALASRMGADGTTRERPELAGVDQLAADLGVTASAVRKHLDTAREKGYLRRDGASYVGHVAAWVACLPVDRAREVSAGGAPFVGEGVTPADTSAGRGAPFGVEEVSAGGAPSQTASDQSSSRAREDLAVIVDEGDRHPGSLAFVADGIRAVAAPGFEANAYELGKAIEVVAERLRDLGEPEALAVPVLTVLVTRKAPRKLVPWVRAATSADDFVRKVAAVKTGGRKSGSSSTAYAMPEWCGRCDRGTRMVEVDDDGTPARCPACHPKLAEAS